MFVCVCVCVSFVIMISFLSTLYTNTLLIGYKRNDVYYQDAAVLFWVVIELREKQQDHQNNFL